MADKKAFNQAEFEHLLGQLNQEDLENVYLYLYALQVGDHEYIAKVKADIAAFEAEHGGLTSGE